MRLIDADKLKEYLGNRYMPEVKEDIDKQPTAYNIGKVVGLLEDMLNNIPLQYENNYEQGVSDGLDKAIKIVKQDGIETDDVCWWKYDESYEYAESGCGSMDTHRIDFSKFKFCPYCRKRIKIRTTYELDK